MKRKKRVRRSTETEEEAHLRHVVKLLRDFGRTIRQEAIRPCPATSRFPQLPVVAMVLARQRRIIEGLTAGEGKEA